MTEASTKISNTTKAVAGAILSAVFLGALSWAGWTTLALINLQTNFAMLSGKIDSIREVKASDDRRQEVDADKLERRLASIEGKLDRALGLVGRQAVIESEIRNHNHNTVLVQTPNSLTTLWKMVEFNEDYCDGLRNRIAESEHVDRLP